MTTLIGRGLAAATFSLLANLAGAQTVTDERSWTETFETVSERPRVTISNVWGSVTLQAGPPGAVSVSIHEVRSAPDRSLFELSKELITLKAELDGSNVFLVVGDPEQRWQRFDGCPGCRVDYQLEATVPAEAIVEVSTVTDGRISVEGISGEVTASNVNGPVRVVGAHDCKSLNSVNGRLDIAFAGEPHGDCRFETVNGDITLTLPDGAGFDAAINLFNGKVISDIDVMPIAIPAKVEQVMEDGRYRYRIEQPAGLRLRNGGPTFSFSSLNGDIRIRKN